jgi:hypothetical protein
VSVAAPATTSVPAPTEGCPIEFEGLDVRYGSRPAVRGVTTAIPGRELVDYADTAEVFERPHEQLTEDYISGRFG